MNRGGTARLLAGYAIVFAPIGTTHVLAAGGSFTGLAFVGFSVELVADEGEG